MSWINSLADATAAHDTDSVTKQMSCFGFYKTKEENFPSIESQKTRYQPSSNHQNKSIIRFRRLFQNFTDKEKGHKASWCNNDWTLQFCVRPWHLYVQKRMKTASLVPRRRASACVGENWDLGFRLLFALDFCVCFFF